MDILMMEMADAEHGEIHERNEVRFYDEEQLSLGTNVERVQHQTDMEDVQHLMIHSEILKHMGRSPQVRQRYLYGIQLLKEEIQET